MPAEKLHPEVLKAIMPPAEYAAWERQQQASREFWATFGQRRYDPSRRPEDSNADHWALFLKEHKDATSYLAVQIAEAIDAAERRARG